MGRKMLLPHIFRLRLFLNCSTVDWVSGEHAYIIDILCTHPNLTNLSLLNGPPKQCPLKQWNETFGKSETNSPDSFGVKMGAYNS